MGSGEITWPFRWLEQPRQRTAAQTTLHQRRQPGLGCLSSAMACLVARCPCDVRNTHDSEEVLGLSRGTPHQKEEAENGQATRAKYNTIKRQRRLECLACFRNARLEPTRSSCDQRFLEAICFSEATWCGDERAAKTVAT